MLPKEALDIAPKLAVVAGAPAQGVDARSIHDPGVTVSLGIVRGPPLVLSKPDARRLHAKCCLAVDEPRHEPLVGPDDAPSRPGVREGVAEAHPLALHEVVQDARRRARYASGAVHHHPAALPFLVDETRSGVEVRPESLGLVFVVRHAFDVHVPKHVRMWVFVGCAIDAQDAGDLQQPEDGEVGRAAKVRQIQAGQNLVDASPRRVVAGERVERWLRTFGHCIRRDREQPSNELLVIYSRIFVRVCHGE
mmetsp:Transcript_8103/g.20216  ORF Transcript_8103/g.20216 Transcript_8103/m.20216 type:complete len:250 (-) Transcript_8103:275-1024(-)